MQKRKAEKANRSTDKDPADVSTDSSVSTGAPKQPCSTPAERYIYNSRLHNIHNAERTLLSSSSSSAINWLDNGHLKTYFSEMERVVRMSQGSANRMKKLHEGYDFHQAKLALLSNRPCEDEVDKLKLKLAQEMFLIHELQWDFKKAMEVLRAAACSYALDLDARFNNMVLVIFCNCLYTPVADI